MKTKSKTALSLMGVTHVLAFCVALLSPYGEVFGQRGRNQTPSAFLNPTTSAADPFGAARVNLPPLSRSRHTVYHYYKLQFLEDGYPGKRMSHGLIPHPIYGPYMISDYLGQYSKTKDLKFLEAAERVADAAIKRMEEHENCLVFWYYPSSRLTSIDHQFYSGLTQARYLNELAAIDVASGKGKYREHCERILASLRLPVSRGGVSREFAGGVGIEESVHEQPEFVLNGWTTALLQICRYHDKTKSENAKAIIDENLLLLTKLLPLYDVPDLANSRYRLLGFTDMRLLFSKTGAVIRDAAIDVPGVGRYTFERGSKSKWANHYVGGVEFRLDGTRVVSGTVSTNVVVNLLSYPDSNHLKMTIVAPEEMDVRFQVGQGRYEPTRASLRTTSFATLATQRLKPGQNKIDIPIEWKFVDDAIYPTNFGKRIAGRYYNSYHFIHVRNMKELYERTGNDVFREYGEKWQGYVDRWPTMPQYRNTGIQLQQYKSSPAK